MNRIIFALLAASLAGCGTLGIPSMPNKKTTNQETIDISCSGFASWDKCHEKAKVICPKGYNVLAKDEDLVAQRRVMRIACE